MAHREKDPVRRRAGLQQRDLIVPLVPAYFPVQFPDFGLVAFENLGKPVAGNEQGAGDVLGFVIRPGLAEYLPSAILRSGSSMALRLR